MFPGMKASAETTTEAVWRERVRAWRASGTSAPQFVRGRGFAASTLRYWAGKFGAAAAPQFVRLVPRTPATPDATALVIEVGGARVRVVPGFDAALLAAVVRALGGDTR